MIGPRKVDKTLVLYGCGKLGHLADEIFKELNIFIYSHIDMKGPITPDDFPISIRGECLVAICVASEPYQPIYESLKAQGWTDIVPVWDIIEAYPEVGIHNGWMVPWRELPYEEEDECDIIFSKIDRESQVHYRSFMGWRITHFEQSDLILTPKDPLPSTLAGIRQRQRIDMFVDDPMKSISIHNEGCELQTIKNGIHLFQKYRPTIDVACYHSRDGLWKIEKFLMDNLPDYRWTFRIHAFMGQGAYITGMPKERL